jgi:hypothetical protein
MRLQQAGNARQPVFGKTRSIGHARVILVP